MALANATVYFSEKFNDGWEDRWVQSKHFESQGTQGKWGISAGKYFGDEAEEKGLQTTEDARFYQISAKFPTFSNKEKDLYIQYSLKQDQRIDCGGGYLKLHPSGIDQEDYNGDSPYNIMFGPDICGATKRTHVIFSNKGKNHLIKKDVQCETDEFTHMYTLIVKPDNTYEVQIDGKEVAKGSLKEDWDILPPKEIPDPEAKKPEDWVDEKTIADPEDKKPEGWDDIPKEITDPEAKKPDDWDNDLDGEWEAPTIPNPDYKGEWRARMIDNPDYKGEWVHPKIANPDFKDDDNLYLYEDNSAVGIEIWQVKAGSIFDNIIITDDAKEAEAFAELVKKAQEGEKKAWEKAEEERKAKEAEEEAKKEAEEDDEETKEETKEEVKEETKEEVKEEKEAKDEL